MHRWHFQRVVRTLVPLLLLLTLLCALMMRQRAIGGGRAFAEDAAYLNTAVAGSLVEHRTYGIIPGEHIPATRDTLWRLLVGALTWLVHDPVSASYLAAALCCVIAVMLMVRIARLLFPFPPFILYASILLILSAGFLLDCISGTSMPLATTLMMAITLFHIEGLQGRRPVLPTSAVLMLGLASWIRIEYLLLWPLLAVHAAVVSGCDKRRRREDDEEEGARLPKANVFVRFLGGLLVLSLFLLPVIAWNVVLIKVPWPRAVGAPLTLDIWTEGLRSALGKVWSLYASALPGSYGEFYLSPFLKGWFQRLLFWFGSIVLVGLSIWRREERPYTLALAVPLAFPLLYALIYPYVGAEGLRIIFRSFAPVVILVAVFGIFRIPFLIEGLYRKWKQGLPAAMGFNTWWISAGAIFLIACVVQAHRLANVRMEQIAEAVAGRQLLVRIAEQNDLQEDAWVTDAPGLASILGAQGVIDLTGETSVEVLLCLNKDGTVNTEAMTDLLSDRKPGAVLLSSNRFEKVVSALEDRKLEGAVPAEGKYPTLAGLRWSDES